MELFFDVESSGFHKKGLSPDDPNQAWIVQLGFILSDENRIYQECCSMLVPPWEDSSIHPGAEKTHGISVHDCLLGGIEDDLAAYMFMESARKADTVVCHNYEFDKKFAADLIELTYNTEQRIEFLKFPHICTMRSSTNFCKLPGKFGKPKWPKLEELHRILFDEDFEGAHDALADVRATRRCFYELRKRGII